MVQIVGEDPAQIKRVTCKKCASILEYTLSEVKSRTSRDYTGCSDTTRFINCPKCGNEIIVKGY